jgi:acetyltransferase-like isoleucine patch superfamily enzyme
MKRIAKLLANGLSRVVMFPGALIYWALRAFGSATAFAGVSQAASLLPGKTGVYLRRSLFEMILPAMGRDVEVSFGALLTSSNMKLGARAYIGPYSVLGEVTIEDDVLIASHVSIINGGHQHGMEHLDIPIREQAGAIRHVTIGAGSWIGERAVVMCNVGRHCVVGAGAVVTQPLPDYAVAVGVPARVIRMRDAAESTKHSAVRDKSTLAT